MNRYVKTNLDGYTCSFRIIGNDANQNVIESLKKISCGDFYNDKNKDEYYINRVYRCYNYAVNSSGADIVCLLNSDMAFSDGWLDNLILSHKNDQITCSRLVESGVLEPGATAIKKFFGTTPQTFKEKEWLTFAKQNSINEIRSGGLYMPMLINKDVFKKANGYPEGNLYTTGIGTNSGMVLKSGDDYFFNVKLKEIGIKHVTVYNSLVYHMQEGEKRCS